MEPSDWIALAQAILLAIASIFAWRTYRLAQAQRRDAARELRASEDRRLLQAIIDEVMMIVREVEEVVPGVGIRRNDRIQGALERLRIVLAFSPVALHNTDLLSAASPSDVDGIRRALDGARVELANAAEQLAPARDESDASLRPRPALLGMRRNPA